MFNLLDEPRRRQHSCSYLWLIVLTGFDYSPGTKKRRMLCIVVSRLPAVFQRLIWLEYQIEVNFASGVGLACADRMKNWAHQPFRTVHIHDWCQPLADERLLDAFRIHRIFIVNLQLREGVAALPYTEILTSGSNRFGSCGQLCDPCRHKKNDACFALSFIVYQQCFNGWGC